VNQWISAALPVRLKPEPGSETPNHIHVTARGWQFSCADVDAGQNVIPPLSTECDVQLTPSTLNWSMRNNEQGVMQQSILHTKCNTDAALDIAIDNISSKEGEKNFGTGINVKWVWPNGIPVSANHESDDVLQLTPTTHAASVGAHSGSLIITVKFQ